MSVNGASLYDYMQTQIAREQAVCEERSQHPRVPGKYHMFYNGVEHFALWDQVLPRLDSDEWIEAVW